MPTSNSLPNDIKSVFSSNQPKALLVDMDGTIVDSLPMLFDAYRAFLHQFGHVGTSLEFLTLIGPSIPEIVVILRDRYHLKGDLNTLLDGYQKGLLTTYRHQIQAFPQVREVLIYAKAMGFKLALVSSAETDIVQACLEGLSLAPFFDVIVSKEPDLKSKPSPDLYLKALELLQINPEACLAIEDAKNGVAASTGAHIFTLWISHGNPTPSPQSKELYMYVNDWPAVLALLEGAMNG